MLFALNPLLTLFDMRNLFTLTHNEIRPDDKKNEDYTILVTTFNSRIPLRYIHFLRKYKSRVIICDDGSDDDAFKTYLAKLEKEGFQVLRNLKKRHVKWELLRKILIPPSKEAILEEGLREVKTKYTIFLDDDSIPETDLGYACECLSREKAQLASVRVFPANKTNVIENLQNIEYECAMLARLNQPYLTSGACIVGETEALRKIMNHHSMFYQGGDIEIGVLAKRKMMHIIHVSFTTYTHVPTTVGDWIKQRIAWMSGNFRHSIINFGKSAFDPFQLIYFGVIVWLLLPFKWLYNFINPEALIGITLLYIPLTYIANWRVRHKLKLRYILIYPIYAGFQVLVITPLGLGWYFLSAIASKNLGFIK